MRSNLTTRAVLPAVAATVFALALPPAAVGQPGEPTDVRWCPAGREVPAAPDVSPGPEIASPQPTVATTAPAGSSSRKTEALGGKWRTLPRSPFAAGNPIAYWAADRLVAIDRYRGRTATYRPTIKRWEQHQALPLDRSGPTWEFGGLRRSAAAGDEVVVVAGLYGPDDAWNEWYAFDVRSGLWRVMGTSPFEGNEMGSTAWTGELLLVVAGDGTAAAYDPAADCWLEMPSAPDPVFADDALAGQRWAIYSAHWTGEELLVVSVGEWPDFPTGVVRFDPATGSWIPGSVGPISGDLVDPVYAQGSLWFMTEDPNDAYGGRYTTNARYDVAADTWELLDHGCKLNTRWATWTGQMIMEPYSDRRAYDPATGQCYRTRPVKDRARGWEPVWTGREFIYWSGAYGDMPTGRPDGVVYRPPRSAVTDEPWKPTSEKLKRAISARREFGFDTDPDVVREIMRDPYQPGSAQHGFPMTEEEQHDLWTRSGFVTGVRWVLNYVSKLPTYGGLWIDQREGGRVAIALTEVDEEVLDTIERRVPKEPDLGWRLVIVEATYDELRQALRRSTKVSRKLDPDAMLWAAGISEQDGHIWLMYDPADVKRMRARKKQLEKRLGVPVVITAGRVRDL